ncbi:HupE/UreJ family protein [Rubritalea spongiae]|uniref:HupE/UreJ family protein n=1 Tax=Rubritalea spongiae TaxID=430797 RepID=A0ABW5E5H3_9BACT
MAAGIIFTKSRMRLLLSIFFFTCLSVNAHIVEQLFVDVTTDEKQWNATVRFDAGIALPEMRADKQALQPRRQWLLEQSTTEQAMFRKEAEKYLRSCLIFSDGNKAIEWTAQYPEWQSSPPQFRNPFTDLGFAYFDIVMNGPLPQQKLNVTVTDGDHPDFVFANGENLLTVEPAQSIVIWQTLQNKPSSSQSFWNFVHYGYRHVLPQGWDHVLFIAALCCLSFKWRPLLAQSLIFTLGHSITMALSITNVLPTLSPNRLQWVEIGIAATIVYIAIENVISQKMRVHRLATIFLFGLIHGLGFAAVLGNTIRTTDQITTPLIAANLGVELGQITVIAIVFLILFWFRQKTYFPKVLKATSCAIALTGSYWIFERIT